MKKLVFTFLIVLIGVQSSWSQCNTAISEHRFSGVMNAIKHKPAGREKRSYTIHFVKANCLNSAQLIDLCLMFPKEQLRYRIASAAYENIVDKENFYDVYDVFTKFSTALRLHDEVLGLHTFVVEDSKPSPPNRPEPIIKPDYTGLHFPDYYAYRGQTSAQCRVPVADRDFAIMLNKIAFKNDENANLSIIKDITQRNCLATAHIMKLCAYLQIEKNRLIYLKFASDKVFDLGNFIEARQLLSHSFYRDDLTYYIQKNIDPILMPRVEVIEEGPCFVTDEEFQAINKAVKDQTFSSDMMKSAKHYLQIRCFSMFQIGEISKVFSSDFDKLKYFKYAYDYAPEPDKYLMFKSYLIFNSNKDNLSDFIISKERGN